VPAHPERIDRYVIQRELGRGSFGAVYLARHAVIGREVALKVLHPERATLPSVLERFLGEARAVAAIGSPHIVQIFDAGLTAEGKAFLAMELLEGEDLSQHLARHGRLSPSRAAELGREVCQALSAAHRAGVIHRDLKPANIFLARGPDGRARAKVLDFGVSKIARPEGEELTMTGTMLGTPHYMAPEQLHSSRDVDGRADLYALGTVLYETLSLELPFDSTTLAGLIAAKVSNAPRSLTERAPDVPGELASVILRALSWDPNARFSTAEEMDEALAKAMAHASSSVPPYAATSGASNPGLPPQLQPTHPNGSATGLGHGPGQPPTLPSVGGVFAQSSIVSPGGRAPGTTDSPFGKLLIALLAVVLGLGAMTLLGFVVLGGGIAALGWGMTHPAPEAPAASAPVETVGHPSIPNTPLPPSAPNPPAPVAHEEVGSAPSPRREERPDEPAPSAPSAPSVPSSAGARVRISARNMSMDAETLSEVERRSRSAIEACGIGSGYDSTFNVMRMASGGGVASRSPIPTDSDPRASSCVIDAFQTALGTLGPGLGMANFHVVGE
jgi:serine/threonine-protein kinase